MSRTYAHTPIWVLEKKSKLINHDHSHGDCTIDDYDASNRDRTLPITYWNKKYKIHKNCNKVSVFYVKCYHRYNKRNSIYAWEDGITISNKIHARYIYSYADERYLNNGDKINNSNLPACNVDYEVINNYIYKHGRYYDSTYINHELYYHGYYVTIKDNDKVCAECDRLNDLSREYHCSRDIDFRVREKHYKSTNCGCYDCEIDMDRSSSRSTLKTQYNNYKHLWNSGYNDLDYDF